jgi:hypothetical protein
MAFWLLAGKIHRNIVCQIDGVGLVASSSKNVLILRGTVIASLFLVVSLQLSYLHNTFYEINGLGR